MVAVAGGIESFSGKGRVAGGGDCRSRVLEDRRGIEILAEVLPSQQSWSLGE